MDAGLGWTVNYYYRGRNEKPNIYKLDMTYNSMTIQTKVRKWGNSYGIVIPSESLKEKNLKDGEEVLVEIEKKSSVKEIYGSLKYWKINSQKFKDEIRKNEK